MTTTRPQRADALERWADELDADELVEAKTAALRTIAELVEQRDDVDTALLDAIRDAHNADRSWSEIAAMLGVAKQAAQRKYVVPGLGGSARVAVELRARGRVAGDCARQPQGWILANTPNAPSDKHGEGVGVRRRKIQP